MSDWENYSSANALPETEDTTVQPSAPKKQYTSFLQESLDSECENKKFKEIISEMSEIV